MKTFTLCLVVIFLAAGCLAPEAGYDRTHGVSARGGHFSPLNLRDASAADQGAMIARAQAEAIKNESKARIVLANLDAEGRRSLMVAQADYMGALANRVQFGNPGRQAVVQKFMELLERFSTSKNVKEQQRIWDAASALSSAIESPALDDNGVSMLPFGGMGYGQPGYGGMNNGMQMPGMVMPIAISGGLQRDPTRGRIVNETNGTICVTVGQMETQIRPQDAVTMILPPGSYRYTAQKIINTATGPVTSTTIGDDFQVDDQWEERIQQGWELRFQPRAFQQ